MFLLKSIYGKVWSDTNSTELAQIPTGQLFLVRPDSIQGSRECLFNNAMATIRRSTQEFNFQLVVTRVYEEGEEQLLDEDEETEDERSFLIDQRLEFRVGTSEGEPAFRWRDLQGDPNDLYEFLAVGTNQHMSSFFETAMYKAMWERKYNKSSIDASERELQEFLYRPDESVTAPTPRKASTKGKTKLAQAADAVRESLNTLPKPRPEPGTPQIEPAGNTIVSCPGDLFFWDMDKEMFEFQGTCDVKIYEISRYEFCIVARQEDANILFHQISENFNARFTDGLTAFTWNNIDHEGSQTSWGLNFHSKEGYEDWKVAFSRALYETLNHSSWSKIKPDEQSYVISSHQADVEMKDLEEEEGEEEEEARVQAELGITQDGQSDSEEEIQTESIRQSHATNDSDSEDGKPRFPKGKNELLTVGFNKDRSYVLRGDKIGVFKATSEGKMEHHGTLSQVKNTRGKAFRPKQMMLHDQDNAMVLMDPGASNSLFKLDIESGKVVEEWKINDDIPVLHMAPETKFAQTQPERTILGASSNALFRIDPRLPGDKLVRSEYRQYTGKNKFSGISTTEKGQVAVASEKGDLRLFDKVGKIAKTALPAMGDPIIGVDITKDGRYIVATCKTYLLVIDAKIPEGSRYGGELGFDRSFPADKKPEPKRLRLENPHVQYMGGQISFSPARFNMGEDQEETSIVTSSGNYVIAWDFKAIKKGKYDKYDIRKYEDAVVQDQFRFGDPNDIVVALQNNVVMINKKHLKSPARPKSYGRSERTSRSSIVNSPF